VSRCKNLIDLFPLEVVGDTLHAQCRKGNGSYFERDPSQHGSVKKSVDGAAMYHPPAAKKRESDDNRRAMCTYTVQLRIASLEHHASRFNRDTDTPPD
jgi:hypothetical protein